MTSQVPPDSEVIIRNVSSDDQVSEKSTATMDQASITTTNGSNHNVIARQNVKKRSTSSSISSQSSRAVHTSGSVIRYLFPVLSWVSFYPVKSYFVYGDLWAGAYLGLYMIPQCIAYSVMSTTYAIFSFYTCIIGSVLYALIGPSRRLSYGVFALVSAVYLGMVIDRVRPMVRSMNGDITGVVTMFTFLVGVYSAAAGLLRLGSFVRFVPYEVLSGFRAGLYVLVISLQVNSLLGLDMVSQMDLGEGKELLWLPRLFSEKFYPHVRDNISLHCVITSVVCLVVFAFFRLLNYYWFAMFGAGRARVVKNIIRLVPIEFLALVVGFVVAYKVDVVKEYSMPIASKIGNDTEGCVITFGYIVH